jgi:hypothetical protein
MHQRQYPLYHRDNHMMDTHSYTSEHELAQMAITNHKILPLLIVLFHLT